MKIAAVADVHCTVNSGGSIRRLLRDAERADVLVLAGDLTDIGKKEEMEVLIEELKGFPLPIVAVPGNHDHESDQIQLLVQMMRQSGICVLNGDSCNIAGVDFVGTKGFCGGFGKLRVQPFGEPALKAFIRAGIDEVLSLEAVLKNLHAPRKVAVLHFAPIKETLLGEEPELFPFLGSSMFGDVLDTYRVDVIFHGHAHHGSPCGQTRTHIPVFNVSRFVQSRFGTTPYFLFDLPS
jgi:hypothetical protein